MDKVSSAKILGKIGIAILAVALVDLGFLNYWIVKKDKELETIQISQARNLKAINEQESANLAKQEPEIAQENASPSPDASLEGNKAVKVSTEVKKETVVQTAQKEIFITLGSGSIKSESYAELSGLEVTIDPAKYSTIDSIVFEASLWVDGGNGRAWAQLYVVDDKNPLIESQISNPTSTGVLRSSGKIPIPNASKTFRVQAKTELVEYAAHVDNARLKITLR